MHRYKTAWYSIRPPVSTRDFGDVSSCEVGGRPGASIASWGGSGVPGVGGRCSGKEGEPKASGSERAGNIDHTAITVNHSKARCTRQVVDTGPAVTNFERSIPYRRNCTFT